MNRHVLLVEDDSGIRDSICMMLELEGYVVDPHVNGEALLKNDFEIPGLFILDKQLPGVDGLDICRYLKSLPDIQNIPVLILSASPEAALLAEKAGANAFLEKPFDKRTLMSVLNDVMI